MKEIFYSSPSARIVAARLTVFFAIGISLLWFIEVCNPSQRLSRQTTTIMDRVVSQRQSSEQEIYCRNTATEKQVFTIQHTQSTVTFLSGKQHISRTSDTVWVGNMSIDIGCPVSL